jgi:2,4-dienoyl-CoA reductase-like NADH-dependent reductase (Old Yellow Enzyme family)
LARYFKFRTLEELQEHARVLGLLWQFDRDLSPLFRPVRVGAVQVGNSLCIQPMEGCDGGSDGSPGELTQRRWLRFGAGGAKLIWGEATAVAEEARATPRQLVLNEATASTFRRLLHDCRQAHRAANARDDDLLVGLQLTHSGRYSYRRPLIAYHDAMLDGRTFAEKATAKCIDDDYPLLSDDYLRRLTDTFVNVARLAFDVGFQFIDIKQCHRYLLNELLAAKTRPGPYGGSLENRTRLARDVICRIKAEVPGLMIATRLNVYDGVPFAKSEGQDVGRACAWTAPVLGTWGSSESDPRQPDLTEPLTWIGEMARLGVALVNVSAGNPYTSPHLLRPFECPPPDGYEAPEHPLVGVDRHFFLTAKVQQAFPELPVVGSGYSYLQEYLFNTGSANIRAGRVTFVGVGRAALPQPDFARRLLDDGQLDRRRICRTFSYCTALMRAKHNELGQFATGCPPFDREVYGPIWRQAQEND